MQGGLKYVVQWHIQKYADFLESTYAIMQYLDKVVPGKWILSSDWQNPVICYDLADTTGITRIYVTGHGFHLSIGLGRRYKNGNWSRYAYYRLREESEVIKLLDIIRSIHESFIGMEDAEEVMKELTNMINKELNMRGYKVEILEQTVTV